MGRGKEMAWYCIRATSGGGHQATTVHFVEITGRKTHQQRLDDEVDDWLGAGEWGSNGVRGKVTRANRPSQEWLREQLARCSYTIRRAVEEQTWLERALRDFWGKG